MENVEKRVPKGEIKFSITLSDEQKDAKSKIIDTPYNFIVGKAGSGKTLLACQIALDLYFKRKVNKIIMTRPTVSNEDNGFLPGSLEEKLEPWLVPIRDNMRKVYNRPEVLEKMEKDGNLELVSLTHFRGRTFDNVVNPDTFNDEINVVSFTNFEYPLIFNVPNMVVLFDNVVNPDTFNDEANVALFTNFE